MVMYCSEIGQWLRINKAALAAMCFCGGKRIRANQGVDLELARMAVDSVEVLYNNPSRDDARHVSCQLIVMIMEHSRYLSLPELLSCTFSLKTLPSVS
jgi:hypothetical protein